MYLEMFKIKKFPTQSPTAKALWASPQTKFTIDVDYPTLHPHPLHLGPLGLGTYHVRY